MKSNLIIIKIHEKTVDVQCVCGQRFIGNKPSLDEMKRLDVGFICPNCREYKSFYELFYDQFKH